MAFGNPLAKSEAHGKSAKFNYFGGTIDCKGAGKPKASESVLKGVRVFFVSAQLAASDFAGKSERAARGRRMTIRI
jgi:hypothetical protein